ncbi:hypothetical protein NQ315_005098 [Exocentrus adspersus]|uniref:Nuclear pore complex protein n=1 Tax=Exocentrus adspersus TaxID=1586481 RepID=A0AAV8VVD1_9CUCU|nr:hypothetical protein NQ315_005098 [Exocentrus adspersus]
MENDLERSLHLLENALSTSGRGLFKRKFREDASAANLLDLSLTLTPHELKKFMFSDGTLPYDETALLNVQADKTVAGSIIQAGNETPWNTAVDSLYTEFYSILQSHSGNHDVLDIVSGLAQSCSDALKIVKSLKAQVAISSVEEAWLENECNTWRLLLFKQDSLVRECQLIIDWLESNAADKDDAVLHFSDSSVGWENTLHQLQFAENIAFSSSKQIVTQMDPDAPHYQRRTLHDFDMEDEKTLAKRIFTEIRCGKLDQAQKLCRQCGHSWKAALFEGWRLFHDPNIKETSEDDFNTEDMECGDRNTLKKIEGNSNRDIWKCMAIKYCKQEYLNSYEKAAVASFCGFMKPILLVCNTWEDYLWAYMKSMVDVRVESEIRDRCVKNKEYIALPEEYWMQRMSLNEVFISLESSKNPVIREESRKPEHVIQKYIILNDIATLFQELDFWTEDSNMTSHHLRFIVHLVLFLDQIGQGHNREITEKVLKAYINRLMDRNEAELIPFYISKLNPKAQVHLYAQYLGKILNNEERKASLIYAEQNGLDVFSITRQVVENARNLPYDVDSAIDLQQKVTDLDKYKISALDWVTFYDNQRADALIQVNGLIFTFLSLGKLSSAQLALAKVPFDTVDKLLSEGDVSDQELSRAMKEYFSYKAYLDSNEAFNRWFQQCKCKPLPPDELPENAQFPEKVAHQHRVSQYKAELERWKLTTSHLAKNARTLLYNVLLFPDGWLVGAKDADYLRSTCIPEVVMLLYSILSESGQHEECIQLADIIASEKHCLYKVYSKEKLGEILTKLCESSVTLLNEKKDPWGRETSA